MREAVSKGMGRSYDLSTIDSAIKLHTVRQNTWRIELVHLVHKPMSLVSFDVSTVSNQTELDLYNPKFLAEHLGPRHKFS
jgi:hypothetical protein